MMRAGKVIVVALVALAVLAIVVSFFREPDDRDSMAFSDVIAAGREGRLERLEIRGSSLDVTLQSEAEERRARIGDDTDLIAALQAEDIGVGGAQGVELDFEGGFSGSAWWGLLIAFVPGVVVVVVLYYAIRNAVSQGVRRADRRNG